MEKIKTFLSSLPTWKLLLLTFLSLSALAAVNFASQYLRQTAKLKLGSDTGLVLSADRQDSLGTFSDSSFTLKSDVDLAVKTVKESVVFFPDTDFDVKQVNARQFNITPKTSLRDNSLYRIKVTSDKKTFSWAFQTKNDFRVVQTLPRDKATYVPLNTGIEVTFSHDKWEDIGVKENNFEVTPFVEGRFERHGRTVSFVPKGLLPDTLYTIKIKKGLKLKGTDETLQDDFVFRFETQSASREQAQLNFSKNFYEFSPSDTPAFDIYSSPQGSEDLTVRVFQYPSPQGFYSDFSTKLSIPVWASNSLRLHRLPVSGLNKVLEFTTPIQKQTYTNYFLFPQALPKGFYLVEVNKSNVVSQALVQVTDLSAYLSISGTKTLVWVNSISSKASLPGAKVSFGGTNQVTGSDGVAYFDTPTSEVEDLKSTVTISEGNNYLYLPVQNLRYLYNTDYQKARRQADRYWSYFYTDRPAYLPTDTIKFWGLLRDRDNLNQKQKFTLQITRSDYNSWDFTPVVISTQELETSDLGTFIGSVSLENYNPGYYGVTAKIGDTVVFSSSLSVETYTKPAYKLSLTPSKKSVIAGESLTYTGQATFFEGSPVPGMELKYMGVKEGITTTDALGRFSFTNTPGIASESINFFPQYTYTSVMPSLPEEGQISASTAIAVFNSSYVFGNSKSETKNKTGYIESVVRRVETEKYTPYAVVDDVFLASPGRQVSGELLENQWNRREVGTYYDFINKVTTPRYEYDRVQTKVSDISLTSDAAGKVQYSFPVNEGKSYNVILRTTDDQDRTTGQDIFVSGSDENYFRNSSIYLQTDKLDPSPNSFAVGEQVNLRLMRGENPLDASASDKFMFLFAQRGLRSYQFSDNGQLGFKYPEAFTPNVFVTAVRFTGTTYQVSESLNLSFNTQSKKLTLSLTLDKASYLPGDTAKLSILAKDQSGSGAQAEVNLSFLDEAYNAIYGTFIDPLSRIYSSLDSDILATYQSHQFPLDASGAEGGGCFLPDTQVLLSDGTTKPIESIKVGDSIKTLKSPSSTQLVAAKVIKTFKHQVSGYLVINNHLRVTSEHNMYINGRWMTAGEIRVGDSFLDEKGKYQSIYSVEVRSGLNTVYNFTVENLGTYFADGMYVHNDKGRELFVDNAFFGSLRTGLDGRGSVDVKLPDNLTSWKVYSQAVTSDLKVGANSSLVVVKQPFFVDAVLNTQYLAGDHPQVLVRAYGESLTPGVEVKFRVQSAGLGLDKSFTAKAFDTTSVDLGDLKQGTHQLSFSAESGNLSDKLVRKIVVINSNLRVTHTTHTTLTSDTKPVGSDSSQTTLIFADQSLGRYFPPLSNLAYTYGDRLDQRLARSLSQTLIKKFFDDTTTVETLDYSPFQAPDGGYALFPYSGADLELSAFVAALTKDHVDTTGLANYFYQQFASAKDSETAAISLFGLSSLDQPVLLLIDSLSKANDLTPLSKIYLALAQAKIGDTEKALGSYKQIMSDYSEKQDQFTFIKAGSDKDHLLLGTALTSALSSLLGSSEADSLLAYTLANSGNEILLVSPQVLAITSQLDNTKPQPVSFAYTLNGKKTTEKLEKGQVFKLVLAPKDIASITFQDLSGSIGLSSSYSLPLDAKTADVSSTVQVGRTYSVRGKNTNVFSTSDLVKVSLPVTYSELSQDGCYQVSDLLPSGLRPITSVYTYGLDSTNVWHPYEVNGQKVSFCIGKGNKNSTINYYARVVSAGSYRAESALIQSLISPAIYNLSPAGAVSIK